MPDDLSAIFFASDDLPTPSITEVGELRYGESSIAIIDQPRLGAMSAAAFRVESRSGATLIVPREHLRSFLCYPVGDRSIRLKTAPAASMVTDKEAGLELNDEQKAQHVIEPLESHGDPRARLTKFTQRVFQHAQGMITRGAQILKLPLEMQRQAALDLDKLSKHWVRDTLSAFGWKVEP